MPRPQALAKQFLAGFKEGGENAALSHPCIILGLSPCQHGPQCKLNTSRATVFCTGYHWAQEICLVTGDSWEIVSVLAISKLYVFHEDSGKEEPLQSLQWLQTSHGFMVSPLADAQVAD